MIKIQYEVSYPGLTPSEEARIANKIASMLQHHIAGLACSVRKDSPESDESGEFINSTKLEISGKIFVSRGAVDATGDAN